MAQIENLKQDCAKISRLKMTISDNFREMSRQKALRSGRLIVLNDSASPKQNNFNVSGAFRMSSTDPIQTASRKFVHFAHSESQ